MNKNEHGIWSIYRAANGWIVIAGNETYFDLRSKGQCLSVFTSADKAASYLRKQMLNYEFEQTNDKQRAK